MENPDLSNLIAEPLAKALESSLAGFALPGAVTDALVGLVDLALLALVAAVVLAAGRLLPATARQSAHSRVLGAGIALACLLLAAIVLWFVTMHPSPDFTTFLVRRDQLLLALFAGAVVGMLPRTVRFWSLSVLSVGFLVQYLGAAAVIAVFATCVAGFAAQRLPGAARPAQALLVHGGLFAALYAWSWHVRQTDVLEALQIQGLQFFVFLRHISFVVATRGSSVPFSDYFFYVCFYPGATGFVGAPEVYLEFARRNLAGRSNYDYGFAAKLILRGGVQLWASSLVPMSSEQMMASATTPDLWLSSVLLFVRIALLVMGMWALVEATALLYGVRLRPNFHHLLSLQNPTELWKCWRGTMTHWLLTHIYAPLGGQRSHQTRNVLAAFAFSGAWHALSAPFLTSGATWLSIAPALVWAALNAAAVVGQIHWQRRRLRILPKSTPPLVARGLRIAGTELLASCTVTVLSFQGAAAARFPEFLQLLIGIAP